ncbi:PIN domain-containing protein [Brevundimonas sp.]|uniref:PIN domain-containing protein n=1 Tax=Brevundimonas sp. TaxID=1871086 RepID=UPI00356317AA
MRIALDTNILVYAEGVNGPERRDMARRIVDHLHVEHEIVVAVQCLGELHRVLTGKARMPSPLAAEMAHGWRRLANVAPSTEAVLVAAYDLIDGHPHQIWDAIILAAAAEAGCGLLLSEDMQDGFVYRGVTVANPFAQTLHPLLASLLETPS